MPWQCSVFVIWVCEEPYAGTRDLIPDLNILPRNWVGIKEAFAFVAEELLALCLVIASLAEEFIGLFLLQNLGCLDCLLSRKGNSFLVITELYIRSGDSQIFMMMRMIGPL
ncbi:hypothetical protein F2P56_021184 [Juglans regia]|uniref:Uncharacterized protein n=1 Tax=Juglans regia TaxID=51240 RepID=A0A833URW4_JUGRE|nr:hypothetical protein F2P56_021184 [Juglans regia]